MNISIIIPTLIGLSVLSIVDYLTYDKRKGYIPSILTTTFILVMFAITHDVFMGILAGLLGIALSDFNLWKGIADYKVYVAVGIGMGTTFNLIIFTLITTLIGLAVAYLIKKVSNKSEMPYIPIIMAGWCASLWLI